MTRMISTGLGRYGTRRLLAGDEFEAKPSLVRALIATGLARMAPKPETAPAAMPEPAPPQITEEIFTSPAPEILQPERPAPRRRRKSDNVPD